MNKVSNITSGGILAALSLIFIYLASIMPTNKLALMTLTSFIIIVCILITGIKNSFLIYITVSLLSLFLVTSKGIAFTYLVFFGLYGFIKFYIERLQNLYLEIFLKLIFFNASFWLLFSLYRTLFMGLVDFSQLKLPFFAVIIFLEGAFLIYDYILTSFIAYFNKNLRPKFKK